jgi:hypothetical protein
LDRELLVLKREEAKIVKEIKDAAKIGNKAGMKIHALSLVRLRKQQTKLQASQAQLRGVRTSITVGALLLYKLFWEGRLVGRVSRVLGRKGTVNPRTATR